MKKKSGNTLAGHLVDSLLEKTPDKAVVRLVEDSTEPASDNESPPPIPDIDLGLDENSQLANVETAEHLRIGGATMQTPISSSPATEEPQSEREPEPTGHAHVHENLDRTNPTFHASGSDDKTYSIPMPQPFETIPPVTSSSETTVRVNSARPPADSDEPSVRVGFNVGARHMGAAGSSDAHLAQSESLRIAQHRISQLEAEVESLRRDNAQLSSAGEMLRRRADEMVSSKEQVERRQTELEAILEEEKSVYRSNLAAKERELHDLRGKVDELEGRLENNFKRVRVRERDLEHRLELMKLENTSTVHSKDELILELKRKIDVLTNEADSYRNKGQDLYKRLDERQQTMRRVVRALRIALSVIEGEEEKAPLKKVD